MVGSAGFLEGGVNRVFFLLEGDDVDAFQVASGGAAHGVADDVVALAGRREGEADAPAAVGPVTVRSRAWAASRSEAFSATWTLACSLASA